MLLNRVPKVCERYREGFSCTHPLSEVGGVRDLNPHLLMSWFGPLSSRPRTGKEVFHIHLVWPKQTPAMQPEKLIL